MMNPDWKRKRTEFPVIDVRNLTGNFLLLNISLKKFQGMNTEAISTERN